MGDSRWFCQACGQDICSKCHAKEPHAETQLVEQPTGVLALLPDPQPQPPRPPEKAEGQLALPSDLANLPEHAMADMSGSDHVGYDAIMRCGDASFGDGWWGDFARAGHVALCPSTNAWGVARCAVAPPPDVRIAAPFAQPVPPGPLGIEVTGRPTCVAAPSCYTATAEQLHHAAASEQFVWRGGGSSLGLEAAKRLRGSHAVAAALNTAATFVPRHGGGVAAQEPGAGVATACGQFACRGSASGHHPSALCVRPSHAQNFDIDDDGATDLDKFLL